MNKNDFLFSYIILEPSVFESCIHISILLSKQPSFHLQTTPTHNCTMS